MDTGKKSKAGKIIKGCLIGIGSLTTIGCIGYVVKEVKREYDETVNENNRLRAFINDHDFYEKEQTNLRSSNYIESPNDEKFEEIEPIYTLPPGIMFELGLNPDGTRMSEIQINKIGEYIDPDGCDIEVIEDIPSGLKLYNPVKRSVLSDDLN